VGCRQRLHVGPKLLNVAASGCRSRAEQKGTSFRRRISTRAGVRRTSVPRKGRISVKGSITKASRVRLHRRRDEKTSRKQSSLIKGRTEFLKKATGERITPKRERRTRGMRVLLLEGSLIFEEARYRQEGADRNHGFTEETKTAIVTDGEIDPSQGEERRKEEGRKYLDLNRTIQLTEKAVSLKKDLGLGQPAEVHVNRLAIAIGHPSGFPSGLSWTCAKEGRRTKRGGWRRGGF